LRGPRAGGLYSIRKVSHTHCRRERLILLNATGIMLVVVLPVIVLTLAFAWWYRASNKRAAYRPTGPIPATSSSWYGRYRRWW
jgi:heme/copper-type cytochrome/quinol oxidase subunit 2